MVDSANSIWRDYVTEGVPASGKHQPPKAKIRALLTSFESVIAAGALSDAVWKSTKALLNADLAHDADLIGVVYDDSTAANNGLYVKVGASGSGSWTQVSTFLPGYQFVTATDDGNSTANAWTMDTSPRLPAGDGVALVCLVVPMTNTSQDVTVSFDGDTAVTVLKASGNKPAVGGLVQYMPVLGVVIDGEFRMRSDQASSAVAAQVEADADRAETAAATAEGAVGALDPDYFRVRLATTANVDLSGGDIANGQTVDGVTVATGDLVLVASQTDETENGLYVAPASGAASRSGLLAAYDDYPGCAFRVIEGTTYGGTTWYCTSPEGGTLDSTDLEFVAGLTPLQINILGGVSSQIARPEDYGGDVQAAMESGKPDLVLDSDYTISSGLQWTTALCPNLKRIINNGRGTVTATGPNYNLLTIGAASAGITNPIVEGFEGIGSFGTGITDESNLNNRGIVTIECENPRLRDIEIRRTKFMAYHNLGSNDVEIDGLRAIECGQAFYSRGGLVGSVKRLLARDTIWAASVFTIAVSLESTDGHSYGVPEDWTFDDIKVSGYTRAQGVMAHSGRRIQYSNINVQDAVIGWSMNPAAAAGGDDYLQDITLNGYNYVGPQTNPSGYSGGNSGIFVAAGSPTPDIVNVALSNINLRFGNAAEQSSSQAAVMVFEARRFTMNGFNIENSYANGILVDDDVRDFAIAGGCIQGVTVVSGVQNGINCDGGSTNIGVIDGVSIRDISDAAGVGVRRAAGHVVTLGDVNYNNVTTSTA